MNPATFLENSYDRLVIGHNLVKTCYGICCTVCCQAGGGALLTEGYFQLK